MVSLSFVSTKVRKGSPLLPEKAEEHNEELLYSSQHLGCEPQFHFSFLHLLPPKSYTCFSTDKATESCRYLHKMLFTWEVILHGNCYFKKFTNIFIHSLYSGSYFQALLQLCDGQTLSI